MTRTLDQAEAAPYTATIRKLMARTASYVVPTVTLSAAIASQIVREQHRHYVQETVEWSLAMYNASPVSGGHTASARLGTAPAEIFDRIFAAVGNGAITIQAAVRAVHSTLEPIYGQRVRVTGWLPGQRVADGGIVLELSGDACPNCTVNPTGYRVGDERNIARCLNSEDCGWTNA